MIARRRTWMLALLAPLALAAAARAESYALVVGVNDCPEFRLPDGSRPRALRGAESDAEAVAAVLAERFQFKKEQVRILLGAGAKRQAFSKALDELARDLQPDDALVLYFAGHGTQIADQRPLDEADGLDEALCLADTTADGTNLLPDDEVGQWIESCKAGRITVIFDCCHAGTGIKDPDDDLAARYLPIAAPKAAPPAGEDKPQPPWQDLQSTAKSLERRSLIALFACQPDQQAYERRFPGQKFPARSGQFTHYLLAALKEPAADLNRDGRVAGSEAAAYIAHQLDLSFNQIRPTRADRQQPFQETSGDDRGFLGSAGNQ